MNPSFDESLLPKVKALPDVAAALGGVQGDAHLIGENGKAIVFGGAPNIGFSVDPPQPQFNSLTLVEGRVARADDEVVVDESTAGKKDLQVGQTIGVQSRGPSRDVPRSSGIAQLRRRVLDRRGDARRLRPSRPRRASSTRWASSTRSRISAESGVIAGGSSSPR